MKIIRMLVNIILSPIRLIILLAQLALGAIIGLSAWAFHLVASVLFIDDIAGWFTGLDKPTFIFILILAICIYLIPEIGTGVIELLTIINEKLRLN